MVGIYGMITDTVFTLQPIVFNCRIRSKEDQKCKNNQANGKNNNIFSL